ncbi:Predicted kinase, aminoglycoside phosphotransferase (APT) family [Amycolatopsis tolypomycina]|uniref:Predicted kinase, aminoglycoside phosphotransferase (APT) family n=1 Tax=Amycolatopsis tolypomycina TaxID=208445 RepID=A0A1H4QYB6_9PSEU|nr:aminoglycoside phosphotransferase family protein [Amycolatopsis tolypomycina]SEC24605.1 Predicted kinase, aminoglycoside phosphotransferase (APT) family [Amycolatopsis tolypomycina]
MLSEEILSWVTAAIGGDARVATVTGLREQANPWLVRFAPAARVEAAVLRLGDPTDPEHRQRFATEVAALRLAGDHGLPAARLIATDLDGAAAGVPAVLTTVLPGHSRIPPVASPERLRGLGATAAALQSVPLTPRTALPRRTRSIADVDFAAQRREKGTTALLAEAEDRLSRLPVPEGPTVFVHGDLWFGNTLWSGDRCTGLVDWDCAGAGPPGIDLGSARFDAALMFGLPAAEQVLEGWQRAANRRADQVAYWDVVAALGTLADMAFCVPALHDQGRTDLDAGILGQRRDAFLGNALRRLDATGLSGR